MNTTHTFVHRWDALMTWMACGFGLGKLSRFPGTLASAAICLVIWWVGQHVSSLVFGIIGLSLAIAGFHICSRAVVRLQREDPREVVWDEFAGMWVTMLHLPPEPAYIALGFVLFRILDIAKPPPLCWIDELVPGGFGVMSDDLIAGLMANLAMFGLLWLTPGITSLYGLL